MSRLVFPALPPLTARLPRGEGPTQRPHPDHPSQLGPDQHGGAQHHSGLPAQHSQVCRRAEGGTAVRNVPPLNPKPAALSGSEKCKARGFTVIVDGRRSQWNTVKTVVLMLQV